MKQDSLKKRKYFSMGGLCYYRKVKQKVGFDITVHYYVERGHMIFITDCFGEEKFIDVDDDNLILVECKSKDYPKIKIA